MKVDIIQDYAIQGSVAHREDKTNHMKVRQEVKRKDLLALQEQDLTCALCQPYSA